MVKAARAEKVISHNHYLQHYFLLRVICIFFHLVAGGPPVDGAELVPPRLQGHHIGRFLSTT